VDGASGRLTEVSLKISELTARMGRQLKAGDPAEPGRLSEVCDRLAAITAQSLGLAEGPPEDLALFLTAHPLRKAWTLGALTFSGGVADLIYGQADDPFKYGDVGPILGAAFKRSPHFGQVEILRPKETIRATVVGAGSNALELSGSTITVSHPEALPLKNLPILKLAPEDEADGHKWLSSRLSEKLSWYREMEGGGFQPLAVALAGVKNPGYDDVLRLRDRLVEGLDHYLSKNDLLVVVIEEDMAKSLGQALIAALPRKMVVSLDSIKVDNGDYIDIGVPVSSGRVVPVVVKTLVFGR
jgi:ethanolamine utilization protein EutA